MTWQASVQIPPDKAAGATGQHPHPAIDGSEQAPPAKSEAGNAPR